MTGRLEVVTGCMFSGKSEELMRRLRRAQIAQQKVVVLKPTVDVRFHEGQIRSHCGGSLDAQRVPEKNPLWIQDALPPDVDVVGIDEIQFFDAPIADLCDQLASEGIRVIVAGLDQDYKGHPFGDMPKLLTYADEVTKLTAICTICGKDATRTQRLDPQGDLVEIGAADKYAARCRMHHTVAPEVPLSE